MKPVDEHGPPSRASNADGRQTPPWRYRLAVRLLYPLLLVWVIVVAWKHARPRGDGIRFLRQRLGLGVSPEQRPRAGQDNSGTPVRWLHAASVGEVLTALPVIRSLIDNEGANTLLVTTTTPTGAEVLRQRAPTVRHRYLPIDLPGAVAEFLAQQPLRSAWIMETELWPWLFALCKRQGIGPRILNARLSERTLTGAARFLAPVYADALQDVHVLARSKEDAQRYTTLGAKEVVVVGDLKQVASTHIEPVEPLLDRPYYLCASTHDDEERRLASAWMQANAHELLVIAPRHPERGDTLAAELSRIAGHRVARRSVRVMPEPQDRIYLADTLGELDAWYAHATSVFVGGSLIERGGHNLMEPARRGLAICCGPHTGNFADATRALLAQGALHQVTTAEAAVAWLTTLEAAHRTAMGARAQTVATRDAGILERYLAELLADT